MEYKNFTSKDLRAVVKLSAALHGHFPESERRTVALLSNLAEAIGAASATACFVAGSDLANQKVQFAVYFGDLEERHRERRYVLLPLTAWCDGVHHRAGAVITFGERQLSSAITRIRGNPSRLPGHSIYSARILDDSQRALCLAFHRSSVSPAFSARDLALLDLIQQSEAALPRSTERIAQDELSPRLDQVLHLLFEGLYEKEVASRLGISIHTVHVYVKSLYRKFNVSSRSELLCRFLASSPRNDPAPPYEAGRV